MFGGRRSNDADGVDREVDVRLERRVGAAERGVGEVGEAAWCRCYEGAAAARGVRADSTEIGS